MKNSHRVLNIPGLLLALTLSGCAGRPDEQLQLAQKAMDEAKEQRAADFAPGDWKSADEAWQEAQGFMGKEQWSQAATALTRSRSRFERARDIAKGKRDDVSREVQNLEKTVGIQYNSLKESVQKKRVSAKVKKSLDDSIQEIEKAIGKLRSEIEGGEYLQARTTAQTTVRQIFEAEQLIR